MNKFRRISGKISAETCLKMDYFGSISLKSPNAEGSPSDSRLNLMNRECENVQTAKTILPLNIFG